MENQKSKSRPSQNSQTNELKSRQYPNGVFESDNE